VPDRPASSTQGTHDAGAHPIAGAGLADYQPRDDVPVYLDPAGDPFCLWV
jgi:hypothetical protein